MKPASDQLLTFLKTGSKPPTEKATSALLDEMRDVVKSSILAWIPPTTEAECAAIVSASKAQKIAKEKQHADTVKQYEVVSKKIKPTTQKTAMTRAEFSKLSATDKSRFSKSGGKLI